MTKKDLNKQYVKHGIYTKKEMRVDDYDKNNDFMFKDLANGKFYEISKPELTEDEIDRYINLKELDHLQSINYYLQFFVLLAIIGIFIGIICGVNLFV